MTSSSPSKNQARIVNIRVMQTEPILDARTRCSQCCGGGEETLNFTDKKEQGAALHNGALTEAIMHFANKGTINRFRLSGSGE